MRNLTGRTFHCLTVTGLDRTPSGNMWLCQCSCGKEAYAKTYDLLHDKKKSCGHLRTEHNKQYAERYLRDKQKMAKLRTGAGSGWTIDESLDELTGLA